MPVQHFIVSLFSNPGDKIIKILNKTEQICPVLCTKYSPLSPGLENYNTFKMFVLHFSLHLEYVAMYGKLTEQYFNVYGYPPIKGTRL